MEIGEAFVRIRPDTSSFKGETSTAVRRDLQATERQFGAFGRGAAYGSGALRGFGRAALYASTSLIGGYGLIFALRKVTDAAKEHQVVEGQLTAAVRASGLNYAAYREEIQKAITAQEDLGFSEESSVRTFTLLLRATRNVAEATQAQALTADIARGRNKSLEVVANAVSRAYGGQTAALRRLVPSIKAGVTAIQAIHQAQAAYAGAAANYAKTAQGAQDRLNVAIHRTEVTIGTALIPTITRLSTHLADWLNQSKNQQRIQHDVNTAVRDGSALLAALATGLSDVKAIATPLVKTMGGLTNAVELLVSVMAARKILAFASALRLVGPAAISAGAGVAIAESEVAAGGATAAAAAARVGLLRTALLRLGPLGVITIGIELAIHARSIDKFTSNILSKIGLGGLSNNFDQKVADLKASLAGATGGIPQIGSGNPLFGGATKTAGSTATSPFVVGKPPFVAVGERQRLRLAVATAQGTKSTADDLRALTDQRVFLAKQIKAETARLGTATSAKEDAKFYDNLLGLQNEQNSVVGQIASIEDQAAAAAKAHADRLAAAAKKAADANARMVANLVKIGRGIVAGTIGIEGALKIGRAAAAGAARRAHLPGSATGRGFTLADLYREAESEFKVYGSNYGPRGTPLSPQDVRGQYSAITLKHKGSVHVTQVFMGQKSPSQAMNDARAGARYLN